MRGQFCGPCLRNRYGEDVRTALLDPVGALCLLWTVGAGLPAWALRGSSPFASPPDGGEMKHGSLLEWGPDGDSWVKVPSRVPQEDPVPFLSRNDVTAPVSAYVTVEASCCPEPC